MTVTLDGVIQSQLTAAQSTLERRAFEAQLMGLAGDVRLLWTPKSTDTTTATTSDLNGRTVTWDATVAARLSVQGSGYKQTFSGTAQYGSVPDTANLSVGNGTADGPLSFIVVANPTDTANARTLAAKYNTGGNVIEYIFKLDTADKLALQLADASAGVNPIRTADAAVAMGALHTYHGTYSAATGGATAASDIALYVDGLAVASTATDEATYVAMENTTATGMIGQMQIAGTPSQLMQGSMALVLISATNLTAQDHWNIYQLCRSYFNF